MKTCKKCGNEYKPGNFYYLKGLGELCAKCTCKLFPDNTILKIHIKKVNPDLNWDDNK